MESAAGTATDPLVGMLLDARYRVERRIARGGMATVYAGTDTRLDRPVAVKVLNGALAEDPDFVSRFEREARIAARLSHPNVVSVFDQGVDDGQVFLIMEYVPGHTLRDVLNERGRLSAAEALDVMEPVLEGLAAAHAAGLVHRDVKPENVLIADDGRVKIGDFGLTRAVGSANATTEGVLIGTVAYLAPEQVARSVADARSDVYSSGVVLYELLTGKPPYSGDTPLSVAFQHVHERVPAPSLAVPTVPPAADEVVVEATQPDPDDRPADAAALLSSVRAAQQLVPRGAELVAGGMAPATQETLVVALPDTAAAQAKRRRGRAPWVALAIVLVIALLGGLGWVVGSIRTTAVPAVVGQDQATAELTLQQAGLKAAVGDPAFSETVAAGLVVSANPDAGQDARRGSTVTLTLSAGPERYAVPALAGQTVEAATAALTATHLAVGNQTQDYSATVPEGQVIATDPAAGTSVKRDTPIALVVSKGPAPVKVPNVVGKAQDAAGAALGAAGLKSAVSGSELSDTVPKGAVIRQSPAAGVSVKAGTTVTVVISLGPPLVTVPDVLDKRAADATAALQAAGFQVKVNKPPVVVLDRVLSQSPGGGTQAPKGSTITITVV